MARQRRHRHVIAHRAHGFLLGFGQRAQDLFALFTSELEKFLEPRQRARVERHRGEIRVDQFGVQVGHALLEPLLVRRAGAVDLVDRFAVEQPPGLEIRGDHLPWAKLALGEDARGLDIPHAGFGRDHEHAVVAQLPARGTQAVAVDGAHGMATVERDNAGGPVPRLAVDRVVLVEREQVGIFVFQRLRGRWNEDAQRLQQVHAPGLQQFQHRIQTHGIGTVDVDHRIEFGGIQCIGAPHMRARLRPDAIAGDGVDLAVVRQQPEWLRQRPARAGVGGETLMEHHRAAGQLRTLQIRIELRQILRQHHALVADAAGGQADHMQPGHVAQPLFGATARQIQRVGEGFAGHACAFDIQHRHHEQLFDRGHRRFREFAAHRSVGGHLAPAGDRKPDLAQRQRERVVHARDGVVVVRHEYDAGGIALAQRDAGFGSQCAQEHIRCFQQQTAAVAGQAVSGDAAAVRHPRERVQRLFDQRSAGGVVEMGNQPETAGIALVARIVEAGDAALVDFHRMNSGKMVPVKNRAGRESGGDTFLADPLAGAVRVRPVAG